MFTLFISLLKKLNTKPKDQTHQELPKDFFHAQSQAYLKNKAIEKYESDTQGRSH